MENDDLVWVSTSEWRCYFEPKNWIAGVNDTRMWDDSPCPSNVGERELQLVRNLLKELKIEFTERVCETSNVFCVHRYICVDSEQIENATRHLHDNLIILGTQLLYIKDL